jgi:hypothetical protein
MRRRERERGEGEGRRERGEGRGRREKGEGRDVRRETNRVHCHPAADRIFTVILLLSIPPSAG